MAPAYSAELVPGSIICLANPPYRMSVSTLIPIPRALRRALRGKILLLAARLILNADLRRTSSRRLLRWTIA